LTGRQGRDRYQAEQAFLVAWPADFKVVLRDRG
jgi:hypothetical protein